jgi:hypothetical protein
MAVETKSIKFTKATITRDDEAGDFIIEELKKEDTVVTNSSNKLLEFVGLEGLTINISKNTETTSEE